MNLSNAVIPFRLRILAPAALAGLLVACTTSTDGLFSGDKVDYRGAAAKTKPLDVPPDLTQLARDSRYQPQGGVVSASVAAAPAAAARPGTAAPAAVPVVALNASGDMRIERQGSQRWLVVPLTPEQLWPQIRAFWEGRGFTIEIADPATGVMETNWSENRAKLPKDAVRNLLGGLLKDFWDTGERDRFRTRIERTPAGSEIFVSHRGAVEVFIDERRENTTWRARPNDPELEAELLARLMMALGAKEEQARTAVASAPGTATAAATPAAAAAVAGTAASPPPARARLLTTPAGTAALEVDSPFDRAWRQVGLALDRSGFTVEDRDRAGGLYYVRYVDPKYAGQEGPGFWARVFGNTSNPQAPVRYRVALKGSDLKTTVSVLTSAGAPEVGENGERIAAMLLKELR